MAINIRAYTRDETSGIQLQQQPGQCVARFSCFLFRSRPPGCLSAAIPRNRRRLPDSFFVRLTWPGALLRLLEDDSAKSPRKGHRIAIQLSCHRSFSFIWRDNENAASAA